MKKIIKKGKTLGFTLTELVIVIVIIAILAMVLIPTYTGYVNRAKDTVDTTLIKTLNDYCREGENLPEYSTANLTDVFEMIDDLSEGAYNKDNIKTSLSSNTLVWNQTTNRFYILTNNGTEDVISTRDDSEPVVPFGQVTYWLMYTKDNEYVKINEDTIDSKYSVYLATTVSNTVLNTTTGLDLGDNTSVKTINYTNGSTSAQTVLMVTNAFDQVLTIDAPLDTVKHYSKIGYVGISAIAQSCYEEYGTTTFIECASGKVVAEEGSVIDTVLVTGNSSNTSLTMSAYDAKSDAEKAAANANAGTVMNNGGTIKHAYATTNVTATLNNDQSSLNVPLTLATSSSDLNDVLVFAENSTVASSAAINSATATLITNSGLTGAAAEAAKSSLYSCTYNENGTHTKADGTIEVCSITSDCYSSEDNSYTCTDCGNKLYIGVYDAAGTYYPFAKDCLMGPEGFSTSKILQEFYLTNDITEDDVAMIVLPSNIIELEGTAGINYYNENHELKSETREESRFIFDNLTNLITIVAPSVTSITGGVVDHGLFTKCTNLTYVNMANLSSVNSNTFCGCSKLKAEFHLTKYCTQTFQSSSNEGTPNITIKYVEDNGEYGKVHTYFADEGYFMYGDYTFIGSVEQLKKAYLESCTWNTSSIKYETKKKSFNYFSPTNNSLQIIASSSSAWGVTQKITLVDPETNDITGYYYVNYVSSYVEVNGTKVYFSAAESAWTNDKQEITVSGVTYVITRTINSTGYVYEFTGSKNRINGLIIHEWTTSKDNFSLTFLTTGSKTSNK